MDDFFEAILGILGTIFVVAIVVFLVIHFIGNPFAKGNGDGGDSSATVEAQVMTNSDVVNEEKLITIVVKQDKYLIDDKELTISEIMDICSDDSIVAEVVIEDNYASVKAWDDIKSILDDMEIVYDEQ
jgi:hypothetical protein